MTHLRTKYAANLTKELKPLCIDAAIKALEAQVERHSGRDIVGETW